jgi:hypothetical protein
MPVFRYRAMINRVSAPGLECRRYWYRYSDDCLRRVGLLQPGGKISLHELCRALDFSGKPEGMDGGEIDRYVQEGRIGEGPRTAKLMS